MEESILNKITHQEIDGFSLWRLGVFYGASYDLVELEPGEVKPPHFHRASDAKLYFVLGEGSIVLNGQQQLYKAGDVYDVPRMTVHGFEATTHSLFLTIQNPPIRNQETDVEDIVFIYKR